MQPSMNAQNLYAGDVKSLKPLFVPATAPHCSYESSRRSVEKMEAEMAYEAFEAAVADRDLIAEELRVLNSHRIENKGMNAGIDKQAQATIKGLQGTVHKLEEECESLQAENSSLLARTKGVESQLHHATDENERLSLELQNQRERAVDVVKHKELIASYEIEQFATQEAIAHAEAAEADNDRLSDTIESLQQQLAEQKAQTEKAASSGPLVMQCADEAAPLRLAIAERIYNIVEDFVEEDEGEKSPVVEHLEKCCQCLSTLQVDQQDPLSWVTSDLEWLGGTVAAFRELIAASTSMAAEAQKELHAAAKELQNERSRESEAQGESTVSMAEHEEKLKETEESANKLRDALRSARADLKECRHQMRNCKSDSEDAQKKLSEQKADREKIDREMKLMEGKLAQALQQKREAYNKSRKVDQEREKHQREMEAMTAETEITRREMEQKLNVTAQEQQEYQSVTCELRAKLEKELRQLQKEHTQAEEDNSALMEDRVNLIAQLTETKIQAQDTLQKIVGEKDELLEKLEHELGGQLAEAQAQLEVAREAQENTNATSERVEQLEAKLAEATEALTSTTSELKHFKETGALAKAEFDRDISELTATVNHMEEAAAERESTMAKNAQDALQKSIAMARADAMKEVQMKEMQMSEHITKQKKTLEDGMALEEQLKNTVMQKEHAEAELQRQMKANMAYEEELQKQKQQVLDARKMAREIEQQRAQKSPPFGAARDENSIPPAEVDKPAPLQSSDNRPAGAAQNKPKSGLSWLKRSRRPSQGTLNKENTASFPVKAAAASSSDSQEIRNQAKLERKAALARLKDRRV